MIVPMKRLTVVCLTADRDRMLEILRDLGVVHLTYIQTPESEDLEKARNYLTYVQRALEVLPKHAQAKPSGKNAEEVVKAIWNLLHQRKEIEEQLEILKFEQARIEPFGNFDPRTVEQLAARGIKVRLYHASPKQQVVAPEGTTLLILSSGRNGTFYALIGKEDYQVDALEVRLPEEPLSEVQRRIRDLEKSLQDNGNQLKSFGGDYPIVSRIVTQAEDKVNYLEARAGMGAADRVTYLRGFCPAEAVDAVRKAATEQGMGIIVEDPQPGDPVPTYIKNPAWVRPIKMVLDFIGVLPGYHEVDISPLFLIFFSLFFAMIVGDGGYGLIFLVLTLVGRKFMQRISPVMFPLMMILSVCTVIWGFLSGNFFGILSLPAPLARFRENWLTEQSNVMLFCFLLGAIHLTIAHVWNIIRGYNSLTALAQVGWIASTWTMFFLARNMVLGYPFPAIMLTVFAVGVVLIVLFMTPLRNLKAEWFNHAMLPLNVVSNFVDVVSYVRLYAVGAASFAMAAAFNEMALGFGFGGFVSGLIAALILFLGHALNIILAIMGVLVHGVRLNTLEFSGHLGLQWSGIKYHPFVRKIQD